MSQTLRDFADMGYGVTYVGAQRPFLFNFLNHEGVEFCLPKCLSGGAIRQDGAVRSDDVLLAPRFAEAMIQCALQKASLGHKIVLWGCYLYPYGLAALLARSAFLQRERPANLWLTPTGSDVWEIGPQLQNLTEWLLNSRLVDAITAYSEGFAAEIVGRYHVERPVKTIAPVLDWRRFEALDCTARSSARQLLNLPSDAFVIVSHSNMRPVKRPEDVIMTADALARTTPRPIVLLMIGPVREDLVGVSRATACEVRWLGVRERVEEFVAAGDVELNCSTHDSYNLSLAEAMSCGIPVVTTDAVGIAAEVHASGGGFLFPAQPIGRNGSIVSDSAIRFLVRLCEDEQARAAAGARARKWASAAFRFRNAATEFATML
jgi:glycosyltransferase involved in cell wall biosynthesis